MRSLITFTFIVLTAAVTFAAVPPGFTFQGRLTDPGGNPVPDGNYNLTLRIYDVAVAGSPIVTLGPYVATSTDGLFSVYMAAFGMDDFFATSPRYIGIQVGADPELSPRTTITSTPFAFRVASVDSAEGGSIQGTVRVSNQLSTLTSLGGEATRLWGPSWGQLLLKDNSGDQVVELNANSSGGSSLSLREEDGSQKIQLNAVDGFLGSTIRLQTSNNVLTAYLVSGDPGGLGGAELELSDISGAPVIHLNASVTGNASAFLPDDAIWSVEMLNEPGVANSFRTGSPSVNSSTDVVIDTVTISVPTAGYNIVTATGWFNINHTTGTDTDVRIWVNTSTSLDFDKFSYHSIDNTLPTETYYASFAISFVDVVSTGSHSYIATADQFSGSGSFTVERLQMIAHFVPTAYGTTVETMPPPGITLDSERDGVGVTSSIRTVRTLQDHQSMVAAEVAKLRAEIEATSARLQKLEESQQQTSQNEQK